MVTAGHTDVHSISVGLSAFVGLQKRGGSPLQGDYHLDSSGTKENILGLMHIDIASILATPRHFDRCDFALTLLGCSRYHYYIKLVPTIYVNRWGTKSYTNQYSVTDSCLL